MSGGWSWIQCSLLIASNTKPIFGVDFDRRNSAKFIKKNVRHKEEKSSANNGVVVCFFPPFFLLFFTGGRKCHCWRRSDRILISYFSKYSQSTFLNVIFNEKLAAKQTFDDEVKMSTDIINVRDAEKS